MGKAAEEASTTSRTSMGQPSAPMVSSKTEKAHPHPKTSSTSLGRAEEEAEARGMDAELDEAREPQEVC